MILPVVVGTLFDKLKMPCCPLATVAQAARSKGSLPAKVGTGLTVNVNEVLSAHPSALITFNFTVNAFVLSV